MKRLHSMFAIAALVCGVVAHTTQTAEAQSGQAEVLNDEGKQLFVEKKYFEAYKKFKAATELDPKGKYYFNVCFSLNYLDALRRGGGRVRAGAAQWRQRQPGREDQLAARRASQARSQDAPARRR